MVKKNIILLVLYFLQFYISNLWGKNISPNWTNSQEPEPHVLGPLEPETLEKINIRSQSRLGKNQQPERLEKKAGAGAAKKLSGFPALYFGILPANILKI